MAMKPNEQIRNYFAKMGKRGGSATTKAKKLSSRENGKLGGRPRKTNNANLKN
jgi:hypothetical protein